MAEKQIFKGEINGKEYSSAEEYAKELIAIMKSGKPYSCTSHYEYSNVPELPEKKECKCEGKCKCDKKNDMNDYSKKLDGSRYINQYFEALSKDNLESNFRSLEKSLDMVGVMEELKENPDKFSTGQLGNLYNIVSENIRSVREAANEFNRMMTEHRSQYDKLCDRIAELDQKIEEYTEEIDNLEEEQEDAMDKAGLCADVWEEINDKMIPDYEEIGQVLEELLGIKKTEKKPYVSPKTEVKEKPCRCECKEKTPAREYTIENPILKGLADIADILWG